VEVGLYVLDVTSIDNVSQTFTADVMFSARWRDPRLASDALEDRDRGRRLGLDEVWHPQLLAMNRRHLERLMPELVQVDAEGNAGYVQRVIGEFSAHLDLRDFPFDSQSLPVTLISVYGPDQVRFVVNQRLSGKVKAFSVAGWDIEVAPAQVGSMFLEAQARELTRVDFLMQARRESGYFTWKVLLPLGFIVLMAWMVFWIDPVELPAQLGVAATAVLTLIAFQLSLGYMLPKVAYLTRVDKFVLGASALVFLALGEGVLTSRLAKRGRATLARRIDAWARWIYLALFGLLLALAFWV
jgi:hypothetical protein